jgi:hypothetical protein
MKRSIPSQVLKRNANLQADPTCRKCGETKTVADFPTHAVDYRCLKCVGEYALRKYHEKRSAMTPDELKAHKARINERQNKSRNERLASMSEADRLAYMVTINAGNTERRYAVRDAAYQAYGGYRCACCGETERAFLSIDHIHNDGAKHKREANIKTGEQMYRWLARNKFPPGFQILCMNCQWGKRNNKGVCPHQERCNDYPAREYGQVAGSAQHPPG